MSKYKPKIVAGFPLSAQNIMRFSRFTRLMCPNCGTISNNHIVIANSYHDNKYFDSIHKGVCIHECKLCGYVDNVGEGFTDSGNYECDQTRDIRKWEDELEELKNEVAELEFKLAKGKKRWAELWNTEEDSQ